MYSILYSQFIIYAVPCMVDTGHCVAHCGWVSVAFDCWYGIDN